MPRRLSSRAVTTGELLPGPYADTRISSRSVRLKVREATGTASSFWLISTNARAVRVRSTCGVAKVGLRHLQIRYGNAAIVGVERCAAAALNRHLERDITRAAR